MARAWKLLLKLIVGTILAFHGVASSSTADIAPGCQKEKNETMEFKKKWDACQTQKLDDLLDRFDNEQYCSPCDEAALRTQLADMRDQLRDSEAQVVEINATLEANRTELTVTKTKLANLNVTLEANRAKLAQTEEKLAVTEANLKKTEEKLVKREAELLDTQTTLANMTATLLKAKAHLREIKSELATSQTQKHRELRQTQNQLAESTDRTSRAQFELAQAKTHLAECKTTQTQTGIELALTQAQLQNSQARRGSLVTEKNSMLELMRLPLNICSSSAPLASINVTKSPARVPVTKIYQTLSHPANFSCESNGLPLSLCMWSRSVKGQQEVTWMNQHGWNVSTDDIQLSSPADLNHGKCSVSTAPVTEIGVWTCILLVAADSKILVGTVEVSDEPEPAIYFSTLGSGIQKLSLITSEVSPMWNTREELYGVAFDAVTNNLYWASPSTIYRAKVYPQTVPEILFATTTYGDMRGISYDWIAGNLYVATRDGNILACNQDTRGKWAFRCKTLLADQGDLRGIAVDSNEGKLYYSRRLVQAGLPCILKANMDGSSSTGIMADSRGANGIAIDFESRELYWAEYYDNRIRSSNLEGGAVVKTAQTTGPYGIAVAGQRIYWGGLNSGVVESKSKSGKETPIQVASDADSNVFMAPNWIPPKNRRNDCEQQNCRGLCVLSGTSYKCVE